MPDEIPSAEELLKAAGMPPAKKQRSDAGKPKAMPWTKAGYRTFKEWDAAGRKNKRGSQAKSKPAKRAKRPTKAKPAAKRAKRPTKAKRAKFKITKPKPAQYNSKKLKTGKLKTGKLKTGKLKTGDLKNAFLM